VVSYLSSNPREINGKAYPVIYFDLRKFRSRAPRASWKSSIVNWHSVRTLTN